MAQSSYRILGINKYDQLAALANAYCEAPRWYAIRDFSRNEFGIKLLRDGTDLKEGNVSRIEQELVGFIGTIQGRDRKNAIAHTYSSTIQYVDALEALFNIDKGRANALRERITREFIGTSTRLTGGGGLIFIPKSLGHVYIKMAQEAYRKSLEKPATLDPLGAGTGL